VVHLVEPVLFEGTQSEQLAISGASVGPFIAFGIEDGGQAAALVVDLPTARAIRDDLNARIEFAEKQLTEAEK